jgi:hypothetical protein
VEVAVPVAGAEEEGEGEGAGERADTSFVWLACGSTAFSLGISALANG